jgi:hypothetical protein
MVTLVYGNTQYNDSGQTHAEQTFLQTFKPTQKSKKCAVLPGTLTFSIDAFPCRNCQILLRNMACNFNITVTEFTYLGQWTNRFPNGADAHGWLVAAKDITKISRGSTFNIAITGPSANRTTTLQYLNPAKQISKTWVMKAIDNDGEVQ